MYSITDLSLILNCLLFIPKGISKEDKDSLNSDMSNMSKKRKGFDYSRLGPKPKKLMGALANKDTLEVRKIPKHLNTISLLHGHFSKFGTVTNIQVSVFYKEKDLDF